MKTAIVVCVFFFAAVALARPGDDKYTDRYDNVDLEEILGNDKLFSGYEKCLLEEGKCTPDGKELKGHIRDALENECAKCTQAQQDGTRRVIKHLINRKAESWKKLNAKYDPDNKFTDKYEKELRDITIN